MAMVSVERAEPGMVLKGPVTDRRGRLLIPAGLELSAKHVKALRMWGITAVEIDGLDQAEENIGAVDPALLELAEQELDSHFRYADRGHAFVSLLFEFCVQRRGRQMQRQREGA